MYGEKFTEMLSSQNDSLLKTYQNESQPESQFVGKPSHLEQ